MEEANVSTLSHDPDMIQTVELLNRRWLSKMAFEIELSRPPSFAFKAGQSIVLIHEALKRYYSLISAPTDPTITLCLQHIPEGKLSPILADVETGIRLKMTGPHGYFTFTPSSRRPVFISTGTGIAPFVSFARSGIAEFTLFQQAASADELYYQPFFRTVATRYFSCFPAAPTAKLSLHDPFCGGVSDCIRENLQPGSYDFYLCGDREMIRNVTLLIDDIYADSRIYTEIFFDSAQS
jgi:ferredoxin-NADP reductase